MKTCLLWRSLRCALLLWIATLPVVTSAQPPGGVVPEVQKRPTRGLDTNAPSQSKPQGSQPSAPTNGTAPQLPSAPSQRKRIGLALGGGGALALSEIGVLRWMEENHVPVDVVAGTSMGALLGALYATGHTPAQMASLTTDKVFAQVFRVSADFSKQNFRRREDARFLPGGFNVGLRHGVSLRNGVLLDYGLNQFLNAQFLPYGAAFQFDDLPLPYRCVATDILVGREAVFTQGPLAEAVRASISIPGVFPPLEDGGHVYVDGALTENLPTDLVKRELHADVVLAVSLPLTAPDLGDTNSVPGVLQRSFSVAAWSNEVRSRALADVVIEPAAPAGVGAADYASSEQLAAVGYKAAQRAAPQLLKYRVSDAEWAEYQARRRGREPQPQRKFARVTVSAPNAANAIGVRDTIIDLPGKKVNADIVDTRLDEIRSDGRFDTYYFLSPPGEKLDLRVTGPANEGRNVAGRELLHPKEKRGPGDETAAQAGGPETQPEPGMNDASQLANNTVPTGSKEDRLASRIPKLETIAPASRGDFHDAVANLPAGTAAQPGDVDLNVIVRDRPGGPPYMLLGGSVIAQTGGTARATVDGLITQQDFGGYGSELRARFRFGFLTEFQPEYYRRFSNSSKWFAAPRLQFYRAPVYIYSDQVKRAERLFLTAGGGLDVGYSQTHYSEWRVGWQRTYQQWHTVTGSDSQPDFDGGAQLARVQYRYNGQDRAMVPRRGLRADVSAGYQFSAVRSEDAPRFEAAATYFRDIGHGNTLSFSGEGGTYFQRNVADPFRFTLGGPLRLTASSFEEYRGTDYGFVRPAYFRRIANLPTPLGQSIYVVGTYEYGHIETQAGPINRQDAFFGLAAETPLGAITLGPAFGDHDHRKLVFTLGRFF